MDITECFILYAFSQTLLLLEWFFRSCAWRAQVWLIIAKGGNGFNKTFALTDEFVVCLSQLLQEDRRRNPAQFAAGCLNL